MRLHSKYRNFELITIIDDVVYCQGDSQLIRFHVGLSPLYQQLAYDYGKNYVPGMARPDQILLIQRRINDQLVVVFKDDQWVNVRVLQESSGLLLTMPNTRPISVPNVDAVRFDGELFAVASHYEQRMLTVYAFG
eukprot:Unigene12742_Nuclearia_a/m.38709 Unigene12742_Nuclearia_a/g.38709  ORF Unigene12742_Nuclearia_a/g.38709 Unigene12742_Nuclearia_a/m.38709 type:complete len:135 (-) Unigene12742_Nuclearia_a:40-444(-)